MTKAILVRLSSDWPQGVPSKVGLLKLAVRLGRRVGHAGLGCISRVELCIHALALFRYLCDHVIIRSLCSGWLRPGSASALTHHLMRIVNS
jgi:hypothetical protein